MGLHQRVVGGVLRPEEAGVVVRDGEAYPVAYRRSLAPVPHAAPHSVPPRLPSVVDDT